MQISFVKDYDKKLQSFLNTGIEIYLPSSSKDLVNSSLKNNYVESILINKDTN